jgi:hypothetical protein
LADHDEPRRDRSYGAVGGAFLTLGFLGQILGDLGIGPGGDRRTSLVSAALLLLVATAVARAALPWFPLQDENLWPQLPGYANRADKAGRRDLSNGQ